MQQILSTIKNSLEESRKRIESGNHESHDLLPTLLLILVELLEQNKESNEGFILSQKAVIEHDGKERSKELSDLVQNNLKNSINLTQENRKFLDALSERITTFLTDEEQKFNNFIKKQEGLYESFQTNQERLILEYISKNKVNNIIIFTLL